MLKMNAEQSQMSVDSEVVQRMIALHCSEAGIQLPRSFRRDISHCLGNYWTLDSFSDARRYVCEPIEQKLDADPTMAEKYGDVFSRVRTPLRIAIGRTLGFDEYVQNPVKGGGPSVQKMLLEFLNSLSPGEPWNQQKLYAWSSTITGAALVGRVTKMLGVGFNREVVTLVLGKNADALLMRNPYRSEHRNIENRHDARRYLTEFIEELPKGESWCLLDLRQWHARNGVRGETVRLWIQNNLGKGEFSGEKVVAVLGEKRAARLLQAHPFEHGVVKKRNERQEEIAKALRIFIRSCNGKPWNTGTIKEHGPIIGAITGHTVYDWIRNHKGPLTAEVIHELLGRDGPRLLARSPLEKKNAHTLVNAAAAKKYLVLYLNGLPAGATWSSQKMKDHGVIADGVTGVTLASWITNNVSANGEGISERAIRSVLGEDADELLPRHRFKPIKVDRLTSDEIAKKYLSILLYSLPEGESFSPQTIFDYGEIADGVNGGTLHAWIMTNHANGNLTEEVVRAVLGDEADELLERNSFERERRIVPIKTVADAQKYLIRFLRELSENSWSPADLVKAPAFVKNGPTGFEVYIWLVRNIRHGNTVNWLYILIHLIPRELFAKHPFTHERWGTFDITTVHGAQGQALTSSRKMDLASSASTERGIEDKQSPTPLALLLEKEEQIEVNKKQAAVQKALLKLDEENYQTVMSFYDGEKVPADKLRIAIKKLKEIVGADSPL